jgi:hypothetical protein
MRRLSLSSNPDVVFEVVERCAPPAALAESGRGQPQMPFMPNGAEVAPDFFDMVVTDPAATHQCFGPPNNKVSAADYAIGLHASSLVADGGTLQIGIGSLGDAIAQALIVRDRHGESTGASSNLCPDGLAGASWAASTRACTAARRCSSTASCADRGRHHPPRGVRRYRAAAAAQRRPHQPTKRHAGDAAALLDAGRIGTPLAPRTWPSCSTSASCGRCELNGEHIGADDATLRHRPGRRQAFDKLSAQNMLGARLIARHLHDRRLLPRAERLLRAPAHHAAAGAGEDRHDAHRLHQPALRPGRPLKRAQRRKARFMNTTMIVTLLGAAASDALESGQVVSGVGGQYNFVAMAHALPDARLLMMLRATHDNKDGLKSSIVWNYGM